MTVSGAATTERLDAVVIGGGIVGCAILRELATRGIDALLLEAEPDIGEGASKANSAILHNGFDAKPDTLEARLLQRSRDLWPDLLDELGVPALVCGALMIARSRDEQAGLASVSALSDANGVATEIVSGGALHDLAPYLTPRAVAALHVPNEGIVDPFWLTRAFAEAAIAAGAEVRRGARVTALGVDDDGVDIGLEDGSRVRAGQVFDAAGLWADDIAALAGDTSFALTPRKGQFLVSELTAGVDRIVLPIPGPLGKGMLVTPIVFGGVLLGPTAEDGTDKLDRSTDEAGRQRILEACRGLVPAVDEMVPIRRFAGVRAVSSTGEYVIRPSSVGDRLTIVAGIRSTGISASPAIAEHAVGLAAGVRGWPSERRGRVAVAAAAHLEFGDDAGAIVCVCRSVGAAEVRSALSGPIPATTTDAVKRRCGAGFGDCQGNRCLADLIARTASARDVPASAVEKGLAGSWLVAEVGGDVALDQAVAGDGQPATGRDVTAPADVLVVGAGPGGIGAALAAAEAGLRVVVVEREDRPGGSLRALAETWRTAAEGAALETFERLASEADGRVELLVGATVVGLERDDDADRWTVDTAAASGARRIETRTVILATGGYVTPRDHVGIAGPRPAGVMTADFAVDALRRGWLPSRRAVVVGGGRIARSVEERLTAAGGEVVERIDGRPGRNKSAEGPARITAVEGLRRLSGVGIGDRLVAADAIVFADALEPASFLLRGLGLGDDRPGVPMPVDATGALPLPGLWAAGTCVVPDVDHAGSLEAGRSVGADVARTLGVGARR